MNNYIVYNQNRWNQVSDRKENPFTIPITHEELMASKEKPLRVALTVGKAAKNQISKKFLLIYSSIL